MIVACSSDGIIGNTELNKLPFYYPEDLKYFKSMTIDSTIIMGRKTYESIGKPLPKRNNVIITSNPISSLECFSSLESAINKYHDCWLIGGKRIYEEGLKYCNEIYMTITPDLLNNSESKWVTMPWIHPVDFVVETTNHPNDANLLLAIYRRIIK